MHVHVALRRNAYRFAYTLLRGYWFVRRPKLNGVKCVLTDGDKVLLVRHTYGAHMWDLPGGRSRRGEQPAATARREMREELGLEIDDWIPLGELHARIDHHHDTLHCFQAEVDAPSLELDRAELGAAKWFPRGQLPTEITGRVAPILRRAVVRD